MGISEKCQNSDTYYLNGPNTNNKYYFTKRNIIDSDNPKRS